MKPNLQIYIKPNTVFNSKIDYLDDGTINYTITLPLDEYAETEIDKLRGYEWNDIPVIIVDRNAILDKNRIDKLNKLNKLIEVITCGYGWKPIHTYIDNVPVIEKIICNGYPTVETYFEQLPLLKKGETSHWYLASSKDGIKVDIDEYEYALRKYTGDNAWHVSDITEHDKQHVVYEFTNTYDDLYY